VFLVLLFYFQQPVNWVSALLYWPLGLLLTIVGTFGPGCLLAALNVKYRDFRYVIPFLVQFLLFLTPVIYPVTLLKNEWLKYLLSVNPMFAAITLFRVPMSGAIPDVTLLSISISSGILFLMVG